VVLPKDLGFIPSNSGEKKKKKKKGEGMEGGRGDRESPELGNCAKPSLTSCLPPFGGQSLPGHSLLWVPWGTLEPTPLGWLPPIEGHPFPGSCPSSLPACPHKHKPVCPLPPLVPPQSLSEPSLAQPHSKRTEETGDQRPGPGFLPLPDQSFHQARWAPPCCLDPSPPAWELLWDLGS
jgi:hypothetical protein